MREPDSYSQATELDIYSFLFSSDICQTRGFMYHFYVITYCKPPTSFVSFVSQITIPCDDHVAILFVLLGTTIAFSYYVCNSVAR
jgi:hypothetical protein